MTVAARLAQLVDEAEVKGLEIAGLEVWDPFELMVRLGELLGYTAEETTAPLRG